ncbi:PTS sugar transporter subunit IIA [Bombilactobacillus thymidiniphilus]|uniref:PTS sugar transporter subunit IIA n=1 Tax=Bombilactobacillus thymidiniphilus TaxID=2923363 RepID=A0ABY4PCE9_9LACO|nr:PTS sugar transporter subunit IIA [Bombilactobacillus thymidiniphilus]UQS83435.1 PTS sugar transporter subunit IIA [Bombilactobacillus thymidiniphilus]
MTPVLICSHGSLATGLLDTAQMICGVQSKCVALTFKTGASVEQFKQQVVTELQKFSEQKVLAVVDIKGGTPFNVLTSLLTQFPNLKIITGANIPMLLQIFLQREHMEEEDLSATAVDQGIAGIQSFDQKILVNDEISEDEEF